MRVLRREPAFYFTVLLTLSLGLGGVVFLFTLVNGVLLNPLQYRDPDGLYAVHERIPKVAKTYPELPVSAAHYFPWRDAGLFAQSMLIGEANPVLTGVGDAERLDAMDVEIDPVAFLGLRLQLGRGFTAEELRPGGPKAVLIAHSLWQRKLQGDVRITSRAITLSGTPHTVVGVLAPGVSLPRDHQLNALFELGRRVEALRPLQLAGPRAGDTGFSHAALVRLKHSPEETGRQMTAVIGRIPGAFNSGAAAEGAVKPLAEQITGSSRRALWMLLAAALALLLVVAVNAGNLNLARAYARERDWAIRAALGAGNRRILLDLLRESAALSLAGGLAGLVLAAVAVPWFVANSGVDLPRLDEVRLDGRVMLAALGFVAAVAAFFGLLPAWRVLRLDPQRVLSQSGRGSTSGGRSRAVLVAVEAAASAALLIVAGLLLASFWRLEAVDRGFRTERLLSTDIFLRGPAYDKREARDAALTALRRELEAQPGIEQAAFTSMIPLGGQGNISLITKQGEKRPEVERPLALFRTTTPGYFAAMGIPIVEGRDYAEQDRGRPVAVISREAARKVWPELPSALGQKFFDGTTGPIEVIGIAQGVRAENLRTAKGPIVYRPHWEEGLYDAYAVVRTRLTPVEFGAVMRRIARQVDPGLPVGHILTVESIVDRSLANARWQARLTVIFAGVALLLAALGVYGVVAQAVEQRSREYGIRRALGATSADLLRRVYAEGLVPVLAGLTVGALIAVWTGRVLASLLFEIQPFDAGVLGAVSATLLVVTVVACALPAWRALRVDAGRMLRAD